MSQKQDVIHPDGVSTGPLGIGLNRRSAILAAGGMAAGCLNPVEHILGQKPGRRRLRVAAVVTAWRHGLHADVLLGKILEGWEQNGGPGPAMELVSAYIDQFPAEDLARPMSRKHGFGIHGSVEQALTLGTGKIAVDGVISIGEHGNYPWNDRQQHLYPRRRFFEDITKTFAKYGRVVPVFNDKHLGPEWTDAIWMYKRAKELKVPFMAGSSMPVGYRIPDVTITPGSRVEAAVGIGYSGLDIYGSHALELFQSIVEQRLGAEQGVRWVQALRDEAVWKAVDDGRVDRLALDAAIKITPRQEESVLREGKGATLFQFEYMDGLVGNILMLPEYAAGTSVAVRIRESPTPIALRFDERTEPRYPHFAYLLKVIECFFESSRPVYPVERTLLTTGILDRSLLSLSEDQKRIMTPELEIKYQPVAYPHANRVSLIKPPCIVK